MSFLNDQTIHSFSAAGLYYLAELVEEYTVATGKIIRWMTLVSYQIIIERIYIVKEFSNY